jgi:hypothetical protein
MPDTPADILTQITTLAKPTPGFLSQDPTPLSTQ